MKERVIAVAKKISKLLLTLLAFSNLHLTIQSYSVYTKEIEWGGWDLNCKFPSIAATLLDR
jgi:hypothetical protein